MGVYFVAYKGLKKLDSLDDEALDFESRTDVIQVRGNSDCPNITAGLEVKAMYQCADEQWFRVSDRWSQFVAWVVQLSHLVGCDGDIPDADSTVAFRDLFRNGQGGTFGPVASAKLAAEFSEMDECARSFADKDFYSLFVLMKQMFEYASKDGAVAFRCA
jgi:hypothetical protein